MISLIAIILVCFALPVGGALLAGGRSLRTFGLLLAGTMSFFVSQVCIRLPLLQVVLPGFGWFLRMGMNTAATVVFYAGTAGLFESLGRQAGLWLTCRNRPLRWSDGVVFGLGHGGFEAVYVLGVTGLSSFFTFGPAIGGNFVPAAVERLFAIALHVALAQLVHYGVVQGRVRWLVLAVLLHGLADGLMLVVRLVTGSIGITFVYLALVAAVCAVGTLLSKGRLDRPAGPAPSSPEILG